MTDLAIARRRDALHQRAQGFGRLTARADAGSTRLVSMREEGCAKIRLPHTHDASLQAVLINTAGGLTGGDDLRWEISADADARLVLTTQACERVYRSLGDPVKVRVSLKAGPGAHVDWLPQETILFDHARLERTIEIDLARGATFCAVEAVLLGRQAMGEAAANARLVDNWRVTLGGELVHVEATRLGRYPGIERTALSLLDGACAYATVLYIGEDAEGRLDSVRAMLPAPASASAAGGRLTIRALASSGIELRRAVTPVVAFLSGAGTLPRLWHT